jgi:hypothetical protein
MRNTVQRKIPMLTDSLWLIHHYKAHYEAQYDALRARRAAFWLLLGILCCIALSVALWLR